MAEDQIGLQATCSRPRTGFKSAGRSRL